MIDIGRDLPRLGQVGYVLDDVEAHLEQYRKTLEIENVRVHDSCRMARGRARRTLCRCTFLGCRGVSAVIDEMSCSKRGDFGIHVNAISPGLPQTQMAEQLGFLEGEHNDMPPQRLGRPSGVANAALNLSSDRSDYVSAMIVDVIGGMFMPQRGEAR